MGEPYSKSASKTVKPQAYFCNYFISSTQHRPHSKLVKVKLAQVIYNSFDLMQNIKGLGMDLLVSSIEDREGCKKEVETINIVIY